MNYFHTNDIMAELELDPNQTYAPVAQLCERLGIAAAAQEKRIKAHSILKTGARPVEIDDENGTRRVLGLRLDLIPVWLTTLEAKQVSEQMRPKLELVQAEAASLLWQAHRPQGYGPGDVLVPERHEQTQAEIAYVSAYGLANLSRQQMLIERQLDAARLDGNRQAGTAQGVDDPNADLLARTARRVAHALAERTRRNEYAGVYSGLFRQFGIASYRRMPQGRLTEAIEWLERWHGDIMGEPEPPPDI
ncbi:MAG: hypothetical protein H7Z42_19715 [Roseiflexaceae bacterium]|nr:hypothetical protein [Roseiflexaceae bacterium]